MVRCEVEILEIRLTRPANAINIYVIAIDLHNVFCY